MDAKTRDLVLLGAVSLFLAGFAWSWGHLVLGSIFVALGAVAARHSPEALALMDQLILKRASASRPSGSWSEDDSEGEVVGRIMKVIAAPEDAPWMWTLAYGHHRDRSPTTYHHADCLSGALTLTPL